MGNSLDRPETKKTTETGQGGDNDEEGGIQQRMTWGVSSMQGWRATMEDAHLCLSSSSSTTATTTWPSNHYLFCVFDGHGGSDASKFCHAHFARILSQQDSFQEYYTSKIMSKSPRTCSSSSKKKRISRNSSNNGGGSRSSNSNSSSTSSATDNRKEEQCQLLQRALEDTFVDLDLELLQELIKKGLIQDPKRNKRNESSSSSSFPTKNERGEDGGDTNVGSSNTNEWGTFTEETDDNKNEYCPQLSSQNDRGEGIPGTTGIAVLITPDSIICANVGDSRAILATTTTTTAAAAAAATIAPAATTAATDTTKKDTDQETIVLALSRDHKPNLPDEEKRILQANGFIALGGRVNGELAVSRAIGDFGFKDYSSSIKGEDGNDKRSLAQKLKISPFPETTIRDRSNNDRLLIVACDGIWDVLSNESCVELVQTLLSEGESNMGLITEEVLDNCLKKGSQDNMTLIAIKFDGQPIGSGGGVMKRRSQRASNK
eukprot:scaffold4658_cov118-Cylindrotheca_fusiformis.AAC.3